MSKSHDQSFYEPLDLRGLVVLQRTSHRGSVTGAATDLGWSYPTADHHLVKLERMLGAQLLVRDKRGSRLTPAGEFVLERGAEILALAQQLIADVRTAQHDSPQVVRLATIPTLGAKLIPRVEESLHLGASAARTNRTLDLQVTIDDNVPILSSIALGRHDVALIVGDRDRLMQRGERLEIEALCAEPLYLCVSSSHPLAVSGSERMPALTLLAEEKWAFGIDDHDVVDIGLKRLCSSAGFVPRVGIRTDDFRTIQHLIAEGVVVGLIPFSGLDSTPSVHAWKVPESLLVRELLLVSRRDTSVVARGTEPVDRRRAVIERVKAEIRQVARAAFPSIV